MEFTITTEEQKILLSDAREAIIAELEKRRASFQQIDGQSILKMPCGAFVTLHKQTNGSRSLRGCIGRMSANLPLIETIRLMAKEAAFGDPRFPPLKKEELEQCHIEISALSPMIPCDDPQKVKVGIHGLYLTCNGRSGVLLPQVPVEQGWNLDEYLNYICIKAGLLPGSYNAPNAQLYTFTAIVFGEEYKHHDTPAS
ncbi:MAG: AmmeMemoRadiSam system protein A [Treponema sp.]|jgi:AmmeMemoRadiSam system protein A|nr:AmmeMemoRadiSam system protein A [Treponema sp.]